MKQIRWGVLGCGQIANTFATSLQALNSGILLAGASRTPGRAEAFALKHGMARSYDDYEDLVKNTEVDAVYVATTHNFHYENVKLCLDHGKHVLCEKPLAINASQTRDLIESARTNDLFLMEGLWTRFLPAIGHVKALLARGAIGEVKTLYANFCIGRDVEPEHRLRNKMLAGGALLDLGIYPINMARIVFDEMPQIMNSLVDLDKVTGVDASSYYLFEYANGQKAILSAGFDHAAPIEAIIGGTKGFIRIPRDFHGAMEVHVHHEGEAPEVLAFPYGEGEGFKYEIEHAMECISLGKKESDIMPLSETLAIMEIMDSFRREWNLVYPGETP